MVPKAHATSLIFGHPYIDGDPNSREGAQAQMCLAKNQPMQAKLALTEG